MELYEPLIAEGEIRVLELGPSSDDGLVRCVLRHVHLSDAPEYEAVSYCWGNPQDTVPIECNGIVIMATRNLYSFLAHLQLETAGCTIWADAVCINQADLAERSSQVRLMGSIYSNAKIVLAWLGEGSPGSDTAMDLMRLFDGIEVGPLPASKFPPASAPVWLEVANLLRRDYFRRVWVIQELALAKMCTVICGLSRVSWSALINVTYYAASTSNIFALRDLDLQSAIAIAATGVAMARPATRVLLPAPGEVLSLLLRHRFSNSTDPRDQIFAMYGILPVDFRNLDITIDYTQDVAEIYRSFAVAVLNQSHNLDLFTIPNLTHERSPQLQNLPSWVPDWTQNSKICSLLDLEGGSGGPGFRATVDTTYQVRFDATQALCGLTGYSVGTVVATVYTKVFGEYGVPAHDYQTPVNDVITAAEQLTTATAEQWKCLDVVAGLQYRKRTSSGELMTDLLCRTMIGGHIEGQWKEIRGSYYTIRHQTYAIQYLLSRNWTFHSPGFLRATKTMAVLSNLSKGVVGLKTLPGLFGAKNKSPGRHVFRMESGDFGLGPPLTAVGDEIFLCKGGKLPLVLRRSGEHWKLVGDCYVHSMVNGEFWDEGKCKQIWLS